MRGGKQRSGMERQEESKGVMKRGEEESNGRTDEHTNRARHHVAVIKVDVQGLAETTGTHQ